MCAPTGRHCCATLYFREQRGAVVVLPWNCARTGRTPAQGAAAIAHRVVDPASEIEQESAWEKGIETCQSARRTLPLMQLRLPEL